MNLQNYLMEKNLRWLEYLFYSLFSKKIHSFVSKCTRNNKYWVSIKIELWSNLFVIEWKWLYYFWFSPPIFLNPPINCRTIQRVWMYIRYLHWNYKLNWFVIGTYSHFSNEIFSCSFYKSSFGIAEWCIFRLFFLGVIFYWYCYYQESHCGCCKIGDNNMLHYNLIWRLHWKKSSLNQRYYFSGNSSIFYEEIQNRNLKT